MPARKKKARRAAGTSPEYPALTSGEYEALGPPEKLRYLEYMKSQEPGAPNPTTMRLLDEVPGLVKQLVEMYREQFGARSGLTRTSMWVHVGVLFGGTAAMVTLGLARVLDAATIVAILGPLYTYVLINLRYLTGWRMVGDNNGDS